MYIAWLDAETNGVNSNTHSLLEVACIITTEDLQYSDSNIYQSTVAYSVQDVDDLYEQAGQKIRDMHDKNGLWNEMRSGAGKPLDVIDEELYYHIRSFAGDEIVILGGSSPQLDRDFVQEFLPLTNQLLHHHTIDVTSIARLADAWYGVKYQKATSHKALDDIKESIEELKKFRMSIFL